MRSIGRDKELKQVLSQIERRVDAQGKLITSPGVTSVGSQVHISVEAPPRGGLSLFLDDVREALKERPGLYPVLVSVSDSSKPQEALRRAFEDIARAAGVAVPLDTTNLSLFELCEELWKRQEQVVVLILDVTQALDQLHGSETLRRSAPSNQLLQRLRVLANDMEDKQPKLATIVGWRSDFRERSIEWKAQDVEMRYYPHVTLWSDFQQSDAWPLFEAILRARGCTEIDGQYPGFCRTGLTVGDILEQLKQTNKRSIDGPLLLSTLKRKRPSETDAAALTDELLVALCLQDATIGPSHPLYDKVTAPAVKPFVNPEKNEQGQVAYVANEDLYQATHVLPNRFRISTVRDYQRQFEDHEPNFAIELLAGLPPTLTGVAAQGAPQNLGGYAKIEFDLPPDLVPTGLKQMRATAYCTLAVELSNDLKTDVAARLAVIESTPKSRATECVLLLHSEPGLGNQFHAAVLAPSKPGWRILDPKGKTAKEKAAALCTVDINAEQAIELAFKQVDPARQSRDLVTHLHRQIKTHFTDVLRNYPALESHYFEGQHLPRLMVDSHTYVDISNSGDDVSEVTLKALEQLGVVQREGKKELRWAFQDDSLLTDLLDRVQRDTKSLSEEMSQYYTFDPQNWPSIAAALATAYSDFLQLEGNTLRGKPPETSLTSRARRALAGLAPIIQELNDLSAESRVRDLEKDLQGLEGRLAEAKDIVDIENLCNEALALVERGGKIVTETRGQRDELEAKLRESLTDLEKAPDPSLSGLRSEIQKQWKQISAREPPLLKELEALQQVLENYRSRARDSQEKRQANVKDAARLRQQLQARRTSLEKIVEQVAVLALEPRDPTRATVEGIRQQLEELDTQIGDEKKHPGTSPDDREKELGAIRSALDTLAIRLPEIAQRLQAPRRVAPPKPAPIQPPPSPVSVSPQPAAGGVPPTPIPAPPAPLSPRPDTPRPDTQRAETPAAPDVAPQSSHPPEQPPLPPTPRNEVTVAPTTASPPEPLPVTNNVSPAQPPTSVSPASHPESASGSVQPVPPPALQPPIPKERRTYTFLNTPEGLRALAEFLDSQPRIVTFTFEPPQT